MTLTEPPLVFINTLHSMTYDLIGLGETMIALATQPGESLRSAAALAVDHAGAESNTCVGLARLGFRVAWVSRLGTDPAGDRILDALRREGVETRWVRRDPLRPTGLMLKEPGIGVRYYRTGSAASALGPDDLDAVPISEARAVLVSGITALIGPRAQEAALALLSGASGWRVVDPNLRAGLWGSDRRVELVRPLIGRANILLGGADELAELLGGSAREPAGAPATRLELEDLARRTSSLGPREIVVRDETVAGALDSDRVWHQFEARRHEPVDPRGAGDAFNAGYLAERLRGGTIEAGLRAGARCGAAVTAALGDTVGFPRALD